VMLAASRTLNCTELLVTPPTVTVTGPLVVLLGTVAVMLVLLQDVTVAAMPLKRSWLLPGLEPKVLPATVTVPPTGAAGGVKLVMTGVTTSAVGLIDSLSNVPAVRAELDVLVTARPTNTFPAIVMVWVDPTCVQFTPSGAAYPLNVFPLRINMNQ
jgi:hypothetical protein